MAEKEEKLNNESAENTPENTAGNSIETQAAETTPENTASSAELDAQPEVKLAEFEKLDSAKPRTPLNEEKLDFLQDLELDVYIELGRARMKIKDILELERGYIIELDKLASEPVDIYVNNKKIADGEVVVIDKHFGIRIVNLNDPAKKLGDMY